MAVQASPTPAIQQASAGQQSSVYQYTQTTSNPQNINTIVAGMIDRTPWRWWDTFTWNVASPTVALPTEVDLFTVPVGQIDLYTNLRKTILDTNMKSSGQFNPPYCLVMFQIGIQIISSDTKGDIDKFFNNCWMELAVLGKVFFQGLPWMFPSGYGLMGESARSSTTVENWTNGFPAPQATWRQQQYARYIPPLTNFTVKFFFQNTQPTLLSNFQIKVFLDGLTDLPVQ